MKNKKNIVLPGSRHGKKKSPEIFSHEDKDFPENLYIFFSIMKK